MRVELDEIPEQIYSLKPNSFSQFKQREKYTSPHSLPPAELYITTSTESVSWLGFWSSGTSVFVVHFAFQKGFVRLSYKQQHSDPDSVLN